LKRLSPDRERNYPNLRAQGYKVSSEETLGELVRYNCVALVADGDQTTWWEPSTVNSKPVKRPGRYWPNGIATDGSIESYVRLYELLGYKRCNNARFEILYEKIAIYGYPEGAFSHVAYQLFFGWISKLGDYEDIKHNTLEALVCDDYGQVKVFMKRRCRLRGYLSRAFFNLTARLWPVDRKTF
jgi:hypothetical protein